jgi:hypothetical protein
MGPGVENHISLRSWGSILAIYRGQILKVSVRRDNKGGRPLDYGNGIAILVVVLGNVMARVTATNYNCFLVLSMSWNSTRKLSRMDEPCSFE